MFSPFPLQLTDAPLQPLPGRQQTVAIVLAVVMALVVIELVRRRRLREDFSFLWLTTALLLLVLAVQQDLVVLFTRLIGAASPTSALFFGALLFLMLVALHSSVRLSKLSFRNKALSQRIALLEEELRREREHRADTDEKPATRHPEDVAS